MKYLFLLFIPLFFVSCKNETNTLAAKIPDGSPLEITYAKGFSIIQHEGFKIMQVNNPWPNGDKSFRYLLVEDSTRIPDDLEYDHKLSIPIKHIVVTSTTHIPSLEMLNEGASLVGFPGLDYISSPQTRMQIDANQIKELGKNEAINTEVLISLAPEAVVGFAINANNKTFSTIEKSGIPVIYNGDWVEESPLGKAEWIKFFGALFNKSNEAEQIFENIESEYLEARELAKSATTIPTVLSGSMYKDQWYVPYGNSWSALFIKDANADYIYKNTTGSGSIALAFESVLSEAQNADFWIAPGQFTSFNQLNETSSHYKQFDAVRNQNVFTYSNTKGTAGGVIYYELAPNRPDLVLKDLISIFHPELLQDYEPVFFKPLD